MRVAMVDALRALGSLWNLGLLVVAVGTLVWFFYWVFLRKLIRARRIANLRFNRIVREQMSQGSDSNRPRD